MSYRAVVKAIPNWYAKTNEQIVAEATAKTIPFADPEWWTSWGVAGCIGPENVTPMLERLRATQYAWVADAISNSKAPFGELAVNNMMLASGDPDLIKLAKATRYKKSLCDHFGVPEDAEAIANTADIMRVEMERELGKAETRQRFNVNMTEWDNWPGPPAERPKL